MSDFNDDIFPAVVEKLPWVPESPTDTIKDICNAYRQFVTVSLRSDSDIDPLFRWARRTVDTSAQQFGIPDDICKTAIDIIKLVANTPACKFYPAACLIQGMFYLLGDFDFAQDKQQATTWLLRAGDAGSPRAFYRLGVELEAQHDIEGARECYETGIKRRDAASYYRLAMACFKGDLNMRVDIEKAKSYLSRASMLADPDCSHPPFIYGMLLLGEMPEILPCPRHDVETAMLAIQKSAWLGYAPAQYQMGISWQGGEMGYDPALALRYFHICSRHNETIIQRGKGSGMMEGKAEAEISKWMLCGYKDVLEPNSEWSFKFALKSARMGNASAELAVGYFHEVGVFVQQDTETAMKWYQLSAEHGYQPAIDRLQSGSNFSKSDLERRVSLSSKKSMKVRHNGSIKSQKRLSSSPVLNSSSATPSTKEFDSMTINSDDTRNSQFSIRESSAYTPSLISSMESSRTPSPLRLSLDDESLTERFAKASLRTTDSGEPSLGNNNPSERDARHSAASIEKQLQQSTFLEKASLPPPNPDQVRSRSISPPRRLNAQHRNLSMPVLAENQSDRQPKLPPSTITRRTPVSSRRTSSNIIQDSDKPKLTSHSSEMTPPKVELSDPSPALQHPNTFSHPVRLPSPSPSRTVSSPPLSSSTASEQQGDTELSEHHAEKRDGNESREGSPRSRSPKILSILLPTKKNKRLSKQNLADAIANTSAPILKPPEPDPVKKPVALTFEEMGIPRAKEEGDCQVM